MWVDGGLYRPGQRPQSFNPVERHISVAINQMKADSFDQAQPLHGFDQSIIIASLHAGNHPRSEEHTSELQSLMRISYAVFCLQKKTKKQEGQYRSKTTKPRRHQHTEPKQY